MALDNPQQNLPQHDVPQDNLPEGDLPGGGLPQEASTQDDLFAEQFQAIVANVGQAILGKHEVLELAATCLLAEGHLLIEDAPGVGKTSLAKALAITVQAEFGRIQFTPDLLPTDVVGATIWNRVANTLDFQPGPVFSGIIVADEINRASPKTQSALLEAMAERQVTVDGTTHHLPRPFMVIATQNPLEHEGTYPLPESQLDRFMMRIEVGYPSAQAELDILDAHSVNSPLDSLRPVLDSQAVATLADHAASVFTAPGIRRYLVQIANATRQHPSLVLGMSTRATLALQQASRVRAAAQGRDYVLPDDIKELAVPVLAHRLMLSPQARAQGTPGARIVDEIMGSVATPVG
ncbi:AAA family ATPase [Candidatus Poriferisocius sp.]|uniref:AAA family ATPase n=1 Tax=Candidatus Poriferisocius sp. TaxID=3101276 RepID=UPI003B5BC7A7